MRNQSRGGLSREAKMTSGSENAPPRGRGGERS